MEAHNNLGVQHMKCAGYEPAVQEFQKAIEIDPGAPAPRLNIALALLKMGRFAEAEIAARAAVRVDGGNAKTDLALVSADGAVLALVRGPGSSPH